MANRRASRNQASVGGWAAAVVVVIAVVAAGVYLVRMSTHLHNVATTQPNPASASSSSPLSSVPPAAQHPISQAESGPAPASTASLPSLEDSDASVLEALASLAGSGDLRSLLVPKQIIQHVVATIDALPRQGMGSFILPLRTPKGAMQTDQANGIVMIADRNASRYAPYMAVLEGADPQAVVAWYKRNYPLFQQAYRELGYPHGYFNDRLLVAIDDMLAAPQPQGPIAVVKTGPHYVFADPRLESLSNGQKLMVRLGATDETQFKAKLRIIRALLTGGRVSP